MRQRRAPSEARPIGVIEADCEAAVVDRRQRNTREFDVWRSGAMPGHRSWTGFAARLAEIPEIDPKRTETPAGPLPPPLRLVVYMNRKNTPTPRIQANGRR